MSPELVCSFSELHPLRSDWHWCSHYCRSVDEYGCGQLWKESAIKLWGTSPMMLCKFSGRTILFQVLFSVPHKREKHLPDENAQLKLMIYTRHSFNVVFCELRTFSGCCRKRERLRERGNHNSVALCDGRVKKGREKKDMTSSAWNDFNSLLITGPFR